MYQEIYGWKSVLTGICNKGRIGYDKRTMERFRHI